MDDASEKPIEVDVEGFHAPNDALPPPAVEDKSRSASEGVSESPTGSNESFSSPGSVKAQDAVAISPAPDQQRPDLSKIESRADKFSRGRIVVILFSLCMALFLAALDITIISTALPTIAHHFKATAADYTWVGSSYLLANAASVPLWGKLSDIWGRKPMLLFANIVFLVGSLIAAVSVTIGMLIGGRVIQGIGGGGLITLVNICIADLFSMRERPKYYGIMGMVWAVASGIGPVVGGAFTTGVSWRWCFYINLPLDGLSLVLLTLFLKLETPRTPFVAGIKAIDWLGVITIVGGIVMFLFGMNSGGITHPWDSAFTLCLIIFGVVSIVLFFLNEWKLAKYPVIPLRLFKDPSNLAAFGVVFVHGFVFIASSYYLPLYFQTVVGASSLLSGVYLFPLVLSLSVTSASAGLFIKKTGRYREPIWFGMCVMTLGIGLFIDLPSKTDFARIIIFQIITGVGVGPNFQSPLIALQSHVKGHDMAVATATFGFVRNLATSISIVLGGVIFQNELSKKRSTLEKALGPQLADQLASESFGSTTEQLRHLSPAQKRVVDQVYTSSLRNMWIFYVALSAFGILISLLITKTKLSKEHESARTGLAEQERVRQLEQEEKRQRKNTLETEKGASTADTV